MAMGPYLLSWHTAQEEMCAPPMPPPPVYDDFNHSWILPQSYGSELSQIQKFQFRQSPLQLTEFYKPGRYQVHHQHNLFSSASISNLHILTSNPPSALHEQVFNECLLSGFSKKCKHSAARTIVYI